MAVLSVGNANAQKLKKVRYDGSDLQAFFNSLPDNSRVIFKKGQEVVHEETLVLENKKNIHLEFNGFTLRANTTGKQVKPSPKKKHKWPRSRAHLSVVNSTGITIKNLNVIGPHEGGGTGEKAYVSSLEAQHAVEIMGCQYILLLGSSFSQIYGDGVYVGGKSSDITIRDCKISNNGRQGIAVTNGANILIEGCELNEIRRAHIDLECNSVNQIVENVMIRNNTFGSKRLMWIAAASSRGVVRNVLVQNNTLNCPASVYIGNSKNAQMQGPYEFTGNHATLGYGNPQGRIWKLSNVNGFRAFNNTIPAQKKRNMVLIGYKNSKNVEVGHNDVPNGVNEALTW